MLSFTDSQKKTIASGITVASLTLVGAFVALVGWGILKLLSFVSVAIVPVVFGVFLALFFKPYYEWWVKITKNRMLALATMLVTILIPAGLFCWYAGTIVVEQVSNLMSQGSTIVPRMKAWASDVFPKAKVLLDQFGVPYQEIPKKYADYGGAAKIAGNSAMEAASILLTVFVSLIFFVFFLTSRPRSGKDIVAEMPFLKPETRNFVAEQIDAFITILVSFFQRQTLICILEGILYGTGFAIVGLPYGFMIGFVLGVLNLIPLFGSIVCLPIALPLAYFGDDGSMTRLLLVLSVWGFGQFADGYFITPRIQGDKTGLGYAGVIFSFIFWSSLLGPLLGMLLAIPLSAFCTVLWRAIKQTYIKPVV